MAPKTDDSWIKDFRSQLRSVTASGWFVRPDNHGKARLVIQREGEKAQTAQIDAPWSKASSGQILTIATELHKLMQERGLELRTAIRVMGEQNTGASTSWDAAAETFAEMMAANVKPVTWAKYQEVLDLVLQVMASRRPAASGIELLEAVVKRWQPGSRRRQQAIQQLSRFLRYRVDRKQLPDSWLPPADSGDFIGNKNAGEAKGQSLRTNKVTELTDNEILALIDSCPDTDAGRRWADALRLMAELGIRPHELSFISAQVDPATGKPFWHCSYEKRAGKTAKTSERKLKPLPIIGTAWNLMQRWQLGDIHLPPLGAGNGAGDAIRHYLMRRPVWKQLEAIYATRGQNIGSYSFRNSYCLRANREGIAVAMVAAALGNTPKVLQEKYSWANDDAVDEAFERAIAKRVA